MLTIKKRSFFIFFFPMNLCHLFVALPFQIMKLWDNVRLKIDLRLEILKSTNTKPTNRANEKVISTRFCHLNKNIRNMRMFAAECDVESNNSLNIKIIYHPLFHSIKVQEAIHNWVPHELNKLEWWIRRTLMYSIKRIQFQISYFNGI